MANETRIDATRAAIAERKDEVRIFTTSLRRGGMCNKPTLSEESGVAATHNVKGVVHNGGESGRHDRHSGDAKSSDEGDFGFTFSGFAFALVVKSDHAPTTTSHDSTKHLGSFLWLQRGMDGGKANRPASSKTLPGLFGGSNSKRFVARDL